MLQNAEDQFCESRIGKWKHVHLEKSKDLKRYKKAKMVDIQSVILQGLKLCLVENFENKVKENDEMCVENYQNVPNVELCEKD